MSVTQSIAITHLLLFAFLAGCASKKGVFHVDQHADIPKGSIPEPAGRKLDAIVTQQILSADQDRFAFYLCDFIGSTAVLSPNADNRLVRLRENGDPERLELVVQPSGDETLDSGRIAGIQARLKQLGVRDASVVIATPPALPLTATQIGVPTNSRGNLSSGIGLGTSGGGGGGRSFRSLNAPFGSFTRPR